MGAYARGAATERNRITGTCFDDKNAPVGPHNSGDPWSFGALGGVQSGRLFLVPTYPNLASSPLHS
jgi:hypothetical protein